VAGTSNDAWWAVAAAGSAAGAVGSYVDQTTFQHQTLAAQLIGSTWTLQPTPNE